MIIITLIVILISSAIKVGPVTIYSILVIIHSRLSYIYSLAQFQNSLLSHLKYRIILGFCVQVQLSNRGLLMDLLYYIL
jgi:hypothetical protein